MIKCVASESTLMLRQVGLTGGPATTANTACAPTPRFRQRWSGHRVQELTYPQTTTVGRGLTRRVCQQPTGSQKPRYGDHERPFPPKPTRDRRPDTLPAAPRRQSPTTTQQPGARRQVIAVVTPQEVECDR